MVDIGKLFAGSTQKSKNNNPASVHPTSSPPPQQGAWWGVGKAVLGAIFAGVVITYYVLLETTCSNNDPNEGAGELVITRGGSAKGTTTGERYLAPLFINAGATLPANGTDEAEILWIEDLCAAVLDCSMCPPVIRSSFNESALYGKLLIYNFFVREESYLCGLNRFARVFAHTGLVGMGTGVATNAPYLGMPGGYPKSYRRGEFRDAKPRGGDMGIPFPVVNFNTFEFSLLLLGSAGSAPIRAVVTPSAPNPWRSVFCGVWKPLATLLIMGHVYVAEQAMSNFIGHIIMSGPRLDLAQLALATETVAHVLMAILHHDPFAAFYWGMLPQGSFVAMLFGSIVLTCSSTLLLAAFW